MPTRHWREKEKMENFIQSYISNISFSKSLEEIISKRNACSEISPLDPILNEEYVEWTAPKWIKQGDIVFFMFSKTSIDTIRNLKKEFKQKISNYTIEEQKIIQTSLSTGENQYKKYGGSIFAIGKANGTLIYDNIASEEKFHWKGRIYAPIDDIRVLENPIHISEFSSFIFISRQSSITPLFGNDFDKLKEIVLNNENISYLAKSKSCPLPLAKINNDNWYELTNEYRRSFFLEYQFREFFVNYLLQIISDTKKIYKECPCIKEESSTTFVDNLIMFEKNYLPVEVKLNISSEKNLAEQCKQYCSLNKMYFSKVGDKEVPQDKVYLNNVLIIDTNGCYIFSEKDNTIEQIFNFDKIKSKEELKSLRDIIKNTL